MRGTKRERQPGVWEFRAYTGRDPVTGRVRQVSRTVHGGKRAADKALAQLVTEVSEGRHGGTRASMASLFDRWLAQCERLGRSPNTMRGYHSAVEAHLRPALGSISVNKLAAAHLDDFYAKVAAEGLAPNSIRRLHSVLATALAQAVRWGWIRSSPTQLASPPSARQTPIRPPSPEEVRKLLVEAEDRNPDLGVMLALAALTGARRGELCGLKWSDLDLIDRTLTIERSITDVHGGWLEKTTKTEGARRVALDDLALAVIGRYRKSIEERARIGEAELVDGAYMFSPRLDGAEPYRPYNVTSAFVRVRHAVGLDHVDLHHLRHFSATQLLGAGVDVRTVAGRLGHANPAITLKVYSHFLEAADRQAAEKIGRLLGPAEG